MLRPRLPARPAARRPGRTGPAVRSRSRRRRPSGSGGRTQPFGTTARITSFSGSVEMNPRGAHPANSAVGGKRWGVRRVRRASDHEPGADRGEGALEAVPGACSAVGLGRRAAAGIDHAVEGLASGVGDHEPGRDAGDAQRADHRARGGADDDVSRGGVPTRLLGERVEPAGQPGASLHPARAEDQSDPHGGEATRTPGAERRGRRPGAGS